MAGVRERPHDWLLSLLVPITDAELAKLERGQRLTFRKLSPGDESQVRASAVFCGRCEIPVEDMGSGERADCKVSPDA